MKRRPMILGTCVLMASAMSFAYLQRPSESRVSAAAEHGDTQVAPPASEAPAKPKPLSREKLRTLSPKFALTPEGGRLLLGAQPDEQGIIHAEIPELEDVLDEEDVDEARRAHVLKEFQATLPDNAQIRSVDVACGESLCRLKMVKEQSSEADWGDIDTAMASFTQGEKIFLTEAHQGTEVGYVYFSGDHDALPLAQVAMPEDDEGT